MYFYPFIFPFHPRMNFIRVFCVLLFLLPSMGWAQNETTVLAAGPYQIRIIGEKKSAEPGVDLWENPTVVYKSSEDSLILKPSQLRWNAKKRIAAGKDIRIEVGFQQSIWEIQTFEINLFKGVLSVLESNWLDKGTKTIVGKGSIYIKKKNPVFEFISTQEETLEGDNWTALGLFSVKETKRGIQAKDDWSLAHLKFVQESKEVASFSGKQIWITADSLLEMPEAKWISKWNDVDSVSHQHVRVQWFKKDHSIHLKNLEGNLSQIRFDDAAHKLSIAADLAIIRLEESKIDFYRISAKNIVPVWVESFGYYDPERARRIQRMLPYNPLRILYTHLVEKKKMSATLSEIAFYANRSKESIQEGFTEFIQNGFLDYDPQTELISFSRLGKHYVKVQYENKDFDKFYVESIANYILGDSASVTFDLKPNYLKVRGINEIMVSDSLRAKLYPSDNQVIFKQGRDFQFKGLISIGNYRFRAQRYDFTFDKYIIQFPKLDSMTFLPTFKGGTIAAKEAGGRFQYQDGYIILSPENDKAGRLGVAAYPKFVAPKGVKVFFDEKWRLNGAYDTNFYFKSGRLELDSLTLKQPIFPGDFYSKNKVFPPLKVTLKLREDYTFGFNYLQESHIPVYQNKGKFLAKEDIILDKQGLHSVGEFQKGDLKSITQKTVFFPDSLKAQSSSTLLEPSKNSNFPPFSVGENYLTWVPDSDSMYVKPSKNRLKFFANAEAELEGNIVIHGRKLTGKGVVIQGESNTKSEHFEFTKEGWLANPGTFRLGKLQGIYKPDVEASDVKITSIISKGVIKLNPLKENQWVQFPNLYVRSVLPKETQIDLKNQTIKLVGNRFQIIQMNTDSSAKFEIPIESTSAIYSIKDRSLELEGVEKFKIGPALVSPANGKLVFLRGGDYKPFSKARAMLDTVHKRHYLKNLEVKSANVHEWKGTADYLLSRSPGDTLSIPLKNFAFEANVISAQASFSEKVPLKIGEFQDFKGDIYLKSTSPNLDFQGSIRPQLGTLKFNTAWIPLNNKGEIPRLRISKDLKDELGRSVTAGIYVNASNKLYPTFLGPMSDEADPVLFNAEGEVTESKTKFEVNGAESTMMLDLVKRRVEAKGPVQLFTNNKLVKSQGIITMSVDSLRPKIEAWLSLQFQVPIPVLKKMGDRIVRYNLDEGLSTAAADEPENREEYVKRAEAVLAKKIPEPLKYSMDIAHLALDKVAPEFASMINFSSVKWEWSPNLSAFYSIGDLPLVNVGPVDVNATVKGFMEVIKKPSKEEFYGYWELSEDLWYYFAYFDGELGVYSSDNSFLASVRESMKTQKKGELKVVEAALEEKNAFVKRFTSYYKPLIPVKKVPVKKEPTKTKPATKGKEKSGGF